jgi:hypothetical protein
MDHKCCAECSDSDEKFARLSACSETVSVCDPFDRCVLCKDIESIKLSSAALVEVETVPCGWCGARDGYEDCGDGWLRCVVCQGN